MIRRTLFDTLQRQANVIGWKIKKRHDGYLLQNGNYGGFLCGSLISVADELADQFKRVIDMKEREFLDCKYELDNKTFHETPINNEVEDTCINCKTSIPSDTSTWGYCEKCNHIVEDALKKRDEV